MVTAQELGLDPRQFRVFEGIYREIMPELRRLGFEPWGPADIMDAQHATVDTRYEEASWGYKVDTDFGIVGTPEKVYVLPHSPHLRAITPKTKFEWMGIPFLENHLPTEVKVYDRRELILGRHLTEKEARTHPLWLDFADGDQKRLDQKVEDTFRMGKKKHSFESMMGIDGIPDHNQRVPFEMPVALMGYFPYLCEAYHGILFGDLTGDTRLIGERLGGLPFYTVSIY